MATGFGEWMMRMVMLVLAGLVTLSILSALAAMSNDAGSGAGGFVVERSPPAAEEAVPPHRQADPRGAPDEGNVAAGESAGPVQAGAGGTGPAAPPRPEHARWLEAIAYALLALAGLLALAILLLWRGLHHLRRIADAAEGRPRNH